MRVFTRITSQSVRALAIFSLMALSATVQQVTPSGATTNTYYTNTGIDISYPQCSIISYATLSPSFAIVGLGHGRPFTTNTCSTSEVNAQAVGTPASFYFNTGYALAYAKSDTTTCQQLSRLSPLRFIGTSHSISQQQAAWAIGCSESDYAIASAPAGPTPVAWWADIETGNSWSTNVTLNQATISGIVDELHTKVAAQVGVYSTPSMWRQIVGTSYTNNGITADWQAGSGSCPSNPALGFTLNSATGTGVAPVWVAQTSQTSISSVAVDVDTAC